MNPKVRAWAAKLATQADMIGPVGHELRNIFNTISLQAVVLSRRVPPEHRATVEELRHAVLEADKMLNILGNYRRSLDPPEEVVDLNHLLRLFENEWQSQGVVVTIEHEQPTPTLPANSFDIERLIRLSVANALPHTQPIRLSIRSDEDECVLLCVWDDGPTAEVPRLQDFFDPFVPARPGEQSLERAACESIVKRMGGSIWPENVAEGGFAINIRLPSNQATT